MNKKIAVVGAGPAGLHMAFLLSNNGYLAEVFEREEKPGGMLQYALPRFRFPREPIEKKAADLEKQGVKFHYSTSVGKDISLEQLDRQFDAVILACGEWKPRLLGCPGENLPGAEQWLPFLRKFNSGKAESLEGKKTVVIGGGDTAMDCAIAASKLGAETILAYRRSREEAPAQEKEIQAVEKAGVDFKFRLAPKEFIGKKGAEKIIFEKTTGLGRDLVGTRELVEVPADFVVVAVGQKIDETIFENSKWDSLSVLPEKFILVGDIVNKKKNIASAIQSANLAFEKTKQIIDN